MHVYVQVLSAVHRTLVDACRTVIVSGVWARAWDPNVRTGMEHRHHHILLYGGRVWREVGRLLIHPGAPARRYPPLTGALLSTPHFSPRSKVVGFIALMCGTGTYYGYLRFPIFEYPPLPDPPVVVQVAPTALNVQEAVRDGGV